MIFTIKFLQVFDKEKGTGTGAELAISARPGSKRQFTFGSATLVFGPPGYASGSVS
jgi:hypothetical protein